MDVSFEREYDPNNGKGRTIMTVVMDEKEEVHVRHTFGKNGTMSTAVREQLTRASVPARYGFDSNFANILYSTFYHAMSAYYKGEEP